MEETKKVDVAAIFFDTVVSSMYEKKAINIDFENQYLLSSGAKSPLYIEASALITDLAIRGRISGAVLLWIDEHCKKVTNKEVDAIVGIAQGGIVWASYVANCRGIDFLYAFARKKDHGLFNQIAGELPFDGANVVVVDDAITSGFSAIEVVKALREGKNGKKANVLGVYSIFDWNFPEVNEKFKELGIMKNSFVTVDQLLEYGVKEGEIDLETYNRLLDFYQNHRNK